MSLAEGVWSRPVCVGELLKTEDYHSRQCLWEAKWQDVCGQRLGYTSVCVTMLPNSNRWSLLP